MVTLCDFIGNRLKSWNHLERHNNRYHRKVMLDKFHLNTRRILSTQNIRCDSRFYALPLKKTGFHRRNLSVNLFLGHASFLH